MPPAFRECPRSLDAPRTRLGPRAAAPPGLALAPPRHPAWPSRPRRLGPSRRRGGVSSSEERCDRVDDVVDLAPLELGKDRDRERLARGFVAHGERELVRGGE